MPDRYDLLWTMKDMIRELLLAELSAIGSVSRDQIEAILNECVLETMRQDMEAIEQSKPIHKMADGPIYASESKSASESKNAPKEGHRF